MECLITNMSEKCDPRLQSHHVQLCKTQKDLMILRKNNLSNINKRKTNTITNLLKVYKIIFTSFYLPLPNISRTCF